MMISPWLPYTLHWLPEAASSTISSTPATLVVAYTQKLWAGTDTLSDVLEPFSVGDVKPCEAVINCEFDVLSLVEVVDTVAVVVPGLINAIISLVPLVSRMLRTPLPFAKLLYTRVTSLPNISGL